MREKDPEKVELIYEVTLRLVRQNGLTGLNMSAISRETRLGMGTIYVYFHSKEDLINSLFRRLKQRNTARIFSGVQEKMPFLATLREVFRGYLYNRLNFYEEHFFVEQCMASHFLDEESRRLNLESFQGIYELLDWGKTEWLVKDLDNALLTAQMMGASNAIAQLLHQNQQKLTDEFLEQAFLLCWDSIKR